MSSPKQPVADKSGEQGAERRRAQRILVDLEVDYQCEDTYLFAYITDMSALGIFVRTNNPELPGTHLNLRFMPPDEQNEMLEVEGEVIWINPFRPGDFNNINPGMGVRFVALSPETKQRLIELIRKIAYLADESEEREPQEKPSESPSRELADAELLHETNKGGN